MLPLTATDLVFLIRCQGPQQPVVPCRKRWRRSRTEEARGSNPLTSTPNLAGQSVASLEPATLTAMLRPQAHVTVQPGRLSETRRLGLRPHTLTTRRGRRRLPTDGDPRRIPSSLSRSTIRSKRPLLNRPPTATTKSKLTRRWPSTACASRKRHGPSWADDARSWTRRRPRRPAIGRAPARPLPRSTTSFRSDTADTGRHGHRMASPDAGGWTLDTWTLRPPHRTPDTD
jgi:hypothetical protein